MRGDVCFVENLSDGLIEDASRRLDEQNITEEPVGGSRGLDDDADRTEVLASLFSWQHSQEFTKKQLIACRMIKA